MVSNNKQKITAVAYDKRGNIVSIGSNSYIKTHTLQARYARQCGKPGAIFLHAEIDAIIKSRGRKIHKIFVSRLLRSGKYGLAKPCKICQRALRDYGVEIIEHT